MAKRKRKDQETPATPGDAYEPPAVDPSAVEFDIPAGAAEPRSPHDPGSADAPRTVVKEVHGVYGRYFKDRRVELIDDGNAGGIGIKLSYDDPKERPSEEVKQILKEGDDQRPGFIYRGDLKQWRKRIGKDADPRTAVAIRLDAERRVDAIGELMGHQERLKAEREQGGDAGPAVPS